MVSRVFENVESINVISPCLEHDNSDSIRLFYYRTILDYITALLNVSKTLWARYGKKVIDRN